MATSKKSRKKWSGPVKALAAFACVFLVSFAAYNLVFYLRDRNLQATYGPGGAKAPVVEKITLSDYRPGHAITFFGSDGASIFIEQTRSVHLFSGGVARVELADSRWFDYDPNQVLGANVTLSPIMISASGKRTELPNLLLEIETPESPIVVTSPESEYLSVNTSIYPVEVRVVPGSLVSINGEDLSAQVDRSGLLSTNVAVEAKGDNAISLLVQTPYHKQARKDIVLYRPVMDIALELDINTPAKTSNSELTIKGKTEPGARIVVDTPHVYQSASVDAQTGEFSFVAQFSAIGTQNVRFRARMDGREDSVISFSVYYLPSIAAYSKTAWRMSYDELRVYFETWNGRVFECVGPVVETFVEGTTQYIIMDVSTEDGPDLLVLENQSSLASVRVGDVYKAYADVSGRYFYQNEYLPMLVARYMDLKQ